MKIAIFRNDGVGDLIVSSPIISNIKNNFPDAIIHIYCSIRNKDLCKELKANKSINNYFLIPKKTRLINIIKLAVHIRKSKYSNVFVLSPKNINYFYAKFSGAITSGVVLMNTTRKGNIKYRPFKWLINYLLQYKEIIDCREDFKNSFKVHYSSHYASVFNKTFNLSDEKINYIKPKIRSIINTELAVNDIKRFIIIHLDEKWNRTNWTTNELMLFINRIKEITKYDIIITEGIIKTLFNKEINKFDFIKLKNSMLMNSTKHSGIYLIKDISLMDLFSLISFSKLVIQHHGGLVHMSSTFNIPIVDMIYPGTENFLNKWKPKSSEFKQIINYNYEDTSKEIIDFIMSLEARI